MQSFIRGIAQPVDPFQPGAVSEMEPGYGIAGLVASLDVQQVVRAQVHDQRLQLLRLRIILDPKLIVEV